VPISDTTRDEAQRLIERYPVSRSALLPLLHLVQADEGYVSEDGIAFCAEVLGLTKAEVGAVSTFYTMYKREPVGDYLLSVCTNPTCKIAGGGAIYDAYVERCGGHVDTDEGGRHGRARRVPRHLRRGAGRPDQLRDVRPRHPRRGHAAVRPGQGRATRRRPTGARRCRAPSARSSGSCRASRTAPTST
jgi:hypothetical protein